MGNLYFSVNLDTNRTLFLAPLTERRLAASGQEIVDSGGYYLYEKRGEGDFANIVVMAHVLTEEAALQLKSMFRMD